MSPKIEPAGTTTPGSTEQLKSVVAEPIQAFSPILPLPTIKKPAPKLAPAATSRVPSVTWRIDPIPIQTPGPMIILLFAAAWSITPGASTALGSIVTSPLI